MYSKIVSLLNLCCLVCVNVHDDSNLGSPSALTRGPSYANSLSYLYQGLPNKVVGLSFAYDNKQKAIHESFVLKLLANPKRNQIQIRDCAVFLVTRLYIDERHKPVLLMGEQDAARNFLCLKEQLHLVKRNDDKLMVEALLAIFGFCLHETSNLWSKRSDIIVRSNVQSFCRRIRVENKLSPDWHFLSLERGSILKH